MPAYFRTRPGAVVRGGMLNDSRRLQGDIRQVIASYKNQFDLLNTEFGKQSVVRNCRIWSVGQNTELSPIEWTGKSFNYAAISNSFL